MSIPCDVEHERRKYVKGNMMNIVRRRIDYNIYAMLGVGVFLTPTTPPNLPACQTLFYDYKIFMIYSINVLLHFIPSNGFRSMCISGVPHIILLPLLTSSYNIYAQYNFFPMVF